MRSAARRLGGEKEGWTVTRVDRRVRTVEDDELDHHLRVVDGKQPRDGAAPVVTHQEATVVTSKHAKRRKKKKCQEDEKDRKGKCGRRQRQENVTARKNRQTLKATKEGKKEDTQEGRRQKKEGRPGEVNSPAVT